MTYIRATKWITYGVSWTRVNPPSPLLCELFNAFYALGGNDTFDDDSSFGALALLDHGGDNFRRRDIFHFYCPHPLACLPDRAGEERRGGNCHYMQSCSYVPFCSPLPLPSLKWIDLDHPGSEVS